MQGITQPTPTHHRGQKMLPPTRIKKRASFLRKRSQKASQKAEERKSGFGFFSVFGSIFYPLRSAGFRSEGKRKPATAGGSFLLSLPPSAGGRFLFFPPLHTVGNVGGLC